MTKECNMEEILVNGLFLLCPYTDREKGRVMYWITDADKAEEDFGVLDGGLVAGCRTSGSGTYDEDRLEEEIRKVMDRQEVQAQEITRP